MSLRVALRPLLAIDGLVALLLLTADGLPVEMFGYGVRAEKLAAEVAGVTAVTRRAFGELGMGQPSGQRIELEGHNVHIYPIADYYLALVTDRQNAHFSAPLIQESALEPLRLELRGES
ncbi:MAG: roadblock/LC7 domain-containing protein [Trueperaceae bacterium]